MPLLTPYEVVKYSPVRRDYPTAYICQMLEDVELKLMNDCFGYDFYMAMIDNLIIYSNVPKYVNGTTYQLDDKVLLDGCIFISIVNSNNDNPIQSDKWGLADKFETECYNELWQRLKKYLAMQVIYYTMNYTTYQNGAKGTVKFTEDNSGIKTVDREEMVLSKKSFLNDSLMILDNLKYWVITKKEECPIFKSISFVRASCSDTSCNTNKRKTRRIFYKR